jgi:glycosyltransferase involved in cell wall biosynthesis
MLDVLHLVDHSTPPDSLEQLSLLVRRTGETVRHRFASLGPHDTLSLAERAGLPRADFTPLPSAGWADPTGWRALRRRVARPEVVHAWGAAGIVAAAAAYGGRVPGVATFTEPPAAGHRRLLRVVDRRGNFAWVASSRSVAQELMAAGIKGERVSVVPAAVSLADARPPAEGITPLRRSLGLAPDDGPVVLLAGDGPAARHDVGIWAVAIVAQMFPRARVVVREMPRGGGVDVGVERFMHALPDEESLVIVPGDIAWGALVHAADIVLATPTGGAGGVDAGGGMGVGSVLAAMAAGVVVLATPVACLTELVAHGETGLVAREARPRAVAARLEEFMGDSTLRYPLADRARARVHGEHSPSAMVEGVLGVYERARAGVVAAG